MMFKYHYPSGDAALTKIEQIQARAKAIRREALHRKLSEMVARAKARQETKKAA